MLVGMRHLNDRQISDLVDIGDETAAHEWRRRYPADHVFQNPNSWARITHRDVALFLDEGTPLTEAHASSIRLGMGAIGHGPS